MEASENEGREVPENPVESYKGKGKGSNPESRKNLRRGEEPSPREGAGKPPKPPLEVGDGDELAAMAWVMGHEEDCTVLHREMRQWKRDNPSEFRKAWTVLKRAAMARSTPTPSDVPGSSSTGAAAPASTPDEGLERLMGLLAREFEEVREWRKGR